MNRVGEFEKVSFEQYYEAIKDEFYKEQEMTPALQENIKKSWEALQLPSRATSGSAGYDFKAPFSWRLVIPSKSPPAFGSRSMRAGGLAVCLAAALASSTACNWITRLA